jgi:hypothetical protein
MIDKKPLNLIRYGARHEARFFTKTILTDQIANRLNVSSADDGGPFIYPVVFKDTDKQNFEYLDDIPTEILAALRSNRGLLVMDHSNEGFCPHVNFIKGIHDRLKILSIPLHRVMFLTQNVKFESTYNSLLQSEGINASDRLHVAVYHCFLRQLSTYVQKVMIPSGEFAQRRKDYVASIYSAENRSKSFLSLNFTPRGHRIAFILYLMQYDLLRMGHVSFPGSANRKYNVKGREDWLLAKQPFPDLDRLRHLLQESDLPQLRLDINAFEKTSPVIDVGRWWFYKDSWFSMVTESGVFGAGVERFTEKPFKAILGLHPFLILGLPNTLIQIKSYGFRSFAPYIDETYDSIDDELTRITTLLSEFRRLVSLPAVEWVRLSQDLLDSVLYNYDHFGGPLQDYFTKEVEFPLIERMSSLALASTGCKL